METNGDEPLTRVQAKIRADIERVGWSAIGVFPVVEGGPSYTYTIGLLEKHRHPELIVYGLPMSQAHGILASAIEQVRQWVYFKPGRRYARVLEGFDVEVRAVNPEGRPLHAARRYYGGDVEAVQLVLPDAAGLFPGEEGVDPEFVRQQDPLRCDRCGGEIPEELVGLTCGSCDALGEGR